MMMMKLLAWWSELLPEFNELCTVQLTGFVVKIVLFCEAGRTALSTGAIAGIAIASVFVVCCVFDSWWFKKGLKDSILTNENS